MPEIPFLRTSMVNIFRGRNIFGRRNMPPRNEANLNSDVSNDLPYFSRSPFPRNHNQSERLKQGTSCFALQIKNCFFSRQMQAEDCSRQLLRVPIQVWWSNLQRVHKTRKPIEKSLVPDSSRLPQRTTLGVLQRKKM